MSGWFEDTAEDSARKALNWRQDPRRELARALTTSGKAITEFSLRKRGEMNTAGRRMVSAIERGDLKELGEGYSDVLLGMTGLTDVRREAEKHGLYEPWLPEGTSTGGRVGASVGGGFLPVAGELYDLYAAFTGYDPIYGERLSSGEQVVSFALFLVPGVSAGAARHADEGADLAQAALRHGPELPGVAASLLRGGDEGAEALEAAASLARRGGDEVLGAASNAGRRAQDVTQEARGVRRTGERRASRMAESFAEAPQRARRAAGHAGDVGDIGRATGQVDEARQVVRATTEVTDAAKAAQQATALADDEWVDALIRHDDAGDLIGRLGREQGPSTCARWAPAASAMCSANWSARRCMCAPHTWWAASCPSGSMHSSGTVMQKISSKSLSCSVPTEGIRTTSGVPKA